MRTHPLRPSRSLKAIYRVVAIIAIATYTAYVFNPDDIVITLILTLVLAAFFYYYRVTVRIKQQALNSALAYTSLADKSFFVYLRSFDTSGRTPIKNNWRNIKRVSRRKRLAGLG